MILQWNTRVTEYRIPSGSPNMTTDVGCITLGSLIVTNVPSGGWGMLTVGEYGGEEYMETSVHSAQFC